MSHGTLDVEEPPKVPGDTEGKRWPQYLAAALATLCTACAGSVMAWSSPALSHLKQADNATNTTGLTDLEASWVSSLAPLGALFGAPPAGFVAGIIGRRGLLLGLSACYIIGWTIIIIVDRYAPMLFVARFICGLALGAGSVVTPLYNEEIAQVEIRGELGVFFDMMVNVGILWSYVGGAALPYQLFCVASAVLPVVFLVTFFWMPESPLFLVSVGREKDARKALSWLRGGYSSAVQRELDSMATLTARPEPPPQPPKSPLATLKSAIPLRISHSPTCKALKIVCLLMALRQLGGINAVVFYTNDIFQQSGSSVSPFWATVVVGAVQLLASFFSSLLVDRTGRRPLLLISEVGIILCLAVFAVFFIFRDAADMSWLPLPLLAVYILVFNLGLGPLPWLIMAEVLTPRARRWAGGVATFINWSLVFIVTNMFFSSITWMGPTATYGGLAAICVVGTVVMVSTVPETKGKTREQIQMELQESS